MSLIYRTGFIESLIRTRPHSQRRSASKLVTNHWWTWNHPIDFVTLLNTPSPGPHEFQARSSLFSLKGIMQNDRLSRMADGIKEISLS